MRNVGGGAADGRYSKQTGGLEVGYQSFGDMVFTRRYTDPFFRRSKLFQSTNVNF